MRRASQLILTKLERIVLYIAYNALVGAIYLLFQGLQGMRRSRRPPCAGCHTCHMQVCHSNGVKPASALSILTSSYSGVAPLGRDWLYARASAPLTAALNGDSVTVTASGCREAEGGGCEDRNAEGARCRERGGVTELKAGVTCWQSAPRTERRVPHIPGRHPPTQPPYSSAPSYFLVV